MKNDIVIMGGALVVGAAAINTSANAGLADLGGDDVTIELDSAFFGSFGSQTVGVGAGEDATFFNNQFIDFNAGPDGDLFTIRSVAAFSSLSFQGDTVSWILTDLDFGADLVGVNIVQSYSDVQAVDLTANSVTFTYTDIEVPGDLYFQAQFVVPTPGAAALLGVAALGTGRRQR